MADERFDEVEAMEAIFGDDFRPRADGATPRRKKKNERASLHFDILVSPEGDDERNWVSVVATFSLGPMYPTKEVAKVSISRRERGPRGFLGPSEIRIAELNSLAKMKATEFLGRVHVYEVVCAMRDKLSEWNIPPLARRDPLMQPALDSSDHAAIAEQQRREEERDKLARIRDAAKQRAEEQVRLRELEAQATKERNIRKQQAMMARGGGGNIGEWSVGSNHGQDLYDDIEAVLNDFQNMRLPPPRARGVEKHENLPRVDGGRSNTSGMSSKSSRRRASGITDRRPSAGRSSEERAILRKKKHQQKRKNDRQGRHADGWDSNTYTTEEALVDEFSEDGTDSSHAPITAVLEPSTDSSDDSSTDDLEENSITQSSLSLSPPDLWPTWPQRGERADKLVHKSPTLEGMAFGSRFRLDFEVLDKVGEGGFGSVVKARNKLDGRVYAVKRVTLFEEEHVAPVVREVVTLSRLMHPNIVRYYQAWLEPPDANRGLDVFTEARSQENTDVTDAVDDSGLTSGSRQTQRQIAAFLYIQMEYCRSTLREFIDFADDSKHDLWAIFRQIIEALNYIHSRGIVHRDLKPTNIFFSIGGDIKVGDFGLAKNIINGNPSAEHADGGLISSEANTSQFDQNANFSASAASADLSVGFGTALYRAPEVEEKGTYSDKLDIYSLGVIAWELWHGPCITSMERLDLLSQLRERGAPSREFEKLNPLQTKLVRALLQRDPDQRPSALHLLEGDLLPPRVEDEYTRALMRHLAEKGSRLRAHALDILFGPDPEINPSTAPEDPATLQLLLSQNPDLSNFALNESGMTDSSSLLVPKHKLRRGDTNEGQVREHLIEATRNVFRAHGALPTTCPPISPETPLSFENHSAGGRTTSIGSTRRYAAGSRVFLSRNGGRMVLTEDSRGFFARSVLRTRVAQKRYEIGRVWETSAVPSSDVSRRKSTTGQKQPSPLTVAIEVEQTPRCILFADFDIVLPSPSQAAPAEVLKAALEVVACFPLAERARIRLGHSGLAKEALRICLGRETGALSGLEQIQKIASCFPYTGWRCARRAMATESNLSTVSIEKIKKFAMVKGSPGVVLRQIAALVSSACPGGTSPLTELVVYEDAVQRRKGGGKDEQATSEQDIDEADESNVPSVPSGMAQAINELAAILTALEALQVSTDEVICIDPLLIHPGLAGRIEPHTNFSGASGPEEIPRGSLYFEDIVFEVFVRRARETRGSGVVTECIGWGGAWDKLLKHNVRQIARATGCYVESMTHAVGVSFNLEKVLQLVTRQGSIDVDLGSSCDVFVASAGTGTSSLLERMHLSSQLWSIGVRADFLYKDSPSSHEQIEAAMDRGAKWLASIRRQRAGVELCVRIKSLGNSNRFEEDIPLSEVAKKFASLRR